MRETSIEKKDSKTGDDSDEFVCLSPDSRLTSQWPRKFLNFGGGWSRWTGMGLRPSDSQRLRGSESEVG